MDTNPTTQRPDGDRRARLRPVGCRAGVTFSSVRDLHWTGQGVLKPAVDASGTGDFGSASTR